MSTKKTDMESTNIRATLSRISHDGKGKGMRMRVDDVNGVVAG